MNEPRGHLVDLTEAERRPMRVCAYVELPFEAVVDRLERASGQELLAAAIRRAAGMDAAGLELRSSGLEVLARGTARVGLSWRVTAGTGEVRSGTLSLLAVQGGNEPLTELLVDLSVRPSSAAHAAGIVRRLLTDLERHLAELASV